MKKIFKGLLYILLLVLVAMIGFFMGTTSKDSSELESITQEDSQGSNTSKVLDAGVVKKLRNIKSVIDSKFLYDYEDKQLEEGIYKGYVSSLKDIYTEYYDAEEYKALNEQSGGEFGGVGIEVSGASEQYIEVIAPIKGTPAEKAGIKSGDKIVKIDGKEVFAKDLSEAVKTMRGEPGKEVTLTIQRVVSEKPEVIDFKLVREIIKVQSVHANMLENNIGYIHITNFQENTAKDFFAALDKLEDDGAKKLILDLRNNPGGLLNVTLMIADRFIAEGKIMSVKYKDGSGDSYDSNPGSDKIPMVTLINGGSASASEVLSGALKDHKRSEIIGEKSFGKGVVQQVIPLGDGTGVKVTVSEYFSPNENKIHGVGVEPTIEEKLNEKATHIGPDSLAEDNQLQKAIEVLGKAE